MKNRVLVIDDDSILRNMLNLILSSSGYEVDLAESARSGLERLREKNYNLIISDVNMPEMDGLSLFNKLKVNCQGLKDCFLFLTADSERETLSFFRENSCKYMSKPFRPRELLTEIDAILKNQKDGGRQSYVNCCRDSWT